MLRALVLALLIANGVFAAYALGWLDPVLGVSAVLGEREPARLERQLRPEAVRVLPPAAARAALVAASAVAAEPSPPAPASCLEAGPYLPSEIDGAEQALAALPPGTWGRSSEARPAVFAVFLGPYASRDSLRNKIEEIARLKLTVEEDRLPGDSASGLVLGRYDSRAEADAALARFSARGVNTARVATLRAATTVHRLRVDNASPALAAQVMALGRGFAPCAPVPAEPVVKP